MWKKTCPLLLTVILTLLSFGTDRAFSQALYEVSQTEKIPHQDFKTWSLFLVCGQDWANANSNNGFDLYHLYKEFGRFGQAIGDDNLAVWFWKRKQVVDTKLASNIDIQRSDRFCTAFKLDPAQGPYLVVTSTYPDESQLSSGLPSNSGVFQLGNMKPDQLSSLLDQVGKGLLQKAGVDTDTSVTPKPPETWGVRLLESVQQVLSSFGCAWTFKIDAGPANAELHPCHAG
jgi:hypothetical protein